MQSGFTLIELSIVLVIIGLIVGGILVGQSLIAQAQLRAVINEMMQFQTATATFRTKYDCLPGDCGNATTFGFTQIKTGISINGDNNNSIGVLDGSAGGGSYTGTVPGNEVAMFWAELYQVGLIKSSFADNTLLYVRSSMRNNEWWVGYSAHSQGGVPAGDSPLGNVFALTGPRPPCAYWGCSTAFSEGMTPGEAQDIDTKIDDGMPFTGNVQPNSGANWIDDAPLFSSVAAGHKCVSAISLTATYAPQSTNPNLNWNLIFKFQN